MLIKCEFVVQEIEAGVNLVLGQCALVFTVLHLFTSLASTATNPFSRAQPIEGQTL